MLVRHIVRFRSQTKSFNLYWVIRCAQLVFDLSSSPLTQELSGDSASGVESVTGGLGISNSSESAIRV